MKVSCSWITRIFLWDFLLHVLSQVSHFSAQGALGTDVPPREEGPAWDLRGPGGGESALYSPCRLSTMVFPQGLGQQVPSSGSACRRRNHADSCCPVPCSRVALTWPPRREWKPGCGHIPPWAWCPAVVIEPPGSICRAQSLPLSMGPAASLTLVLAPQGQAVALLPFFSSLTGDRLQELRHILEKLIVSHFPMRSGEFPPGTLRYSNYVDCMKKVSFQ